MIDTSQVLTQRLQAIGAAVGQPPGHLAPPGHGSVSASTFGASSETFLVGERLTNLYLGLARFARHHDLIPQLTPAYTHSPRAVQAKHNFLQKNAELNSALFDEINQLIAHSNQYTATESTGSKEGKTNG